MNQVTVEFPATHSVVVVILNEVKNLGSRPVLRNKEILRAAQDDALRYSSACTGHHRRDSHHASPVRTRE